jgi:heat shock protein HtpX
MDCGMVPLIKNYIAYSIIAISLLSITPIAYKRYIFRRYRVERFYDTEGFLRSISIKNSRIFIVDSALPKAFTIGKDVFITSGMVELLDDEELKAVIAHEAFHIRQNRYPLINTFRFVTFIPFSFELLADRYAKNFAGERALNNAKRKLVDFYSS